MIAQNFEYVVPTSLGEAVNLLQKHGGRAKVVAGGHSLIPMMKLRLAAPEFLIDIGRIPELSYIKDEGGKIRVGALTTHYTIETSDVIRRRLPALTDAAGAEATASKSGRNRFGMLNWNLWHTWEHYGNVVVYLRLKGLVPPSSEKAPLAKIE